MAFVHLGSDERVATFFNEVGLSGLPAVSDPQGELYARFGLGRAVLRDVVSLRTLAAGSRAYFHGFRQGQREGDAAQKAGAFLIKDGEVVREFAGGGLGDTPDWLSFARLD